MRLGYKDVIILVHVFIISIIIKILKPKYMITLTKKIKPKIQLP